jgi:hypothetical protein
VSAEIVPLSWTRPGPPQQSCASIRPIFTSIWTAANCSTPKPHDISPHDPWIPLKLLWNPGQHFDFRENVEHAAEKASIMADTQRPSCALHGIQIRNVRPIPLPGPVARQLPDQSTTLRVDPSSTSDSRLRGAQPTTDVSRYRPSSKTITAVAPMYVEVDTAFDQSCGDTK